jgi:hypothetical protein
MSKLIRWETPFSKAVLPSVILLNLTDVYKSTDLLTLIVAPDGIDKYPKYLAKFENIIAFTCMEEAYSPEREYSKVEAEEVSCAYEWIDSPWLKAYEQGEHFIAGGKTKPFYHYVIFGGDNNVEIITPNRPFIEIISEKTTININLVV